MPYCLSCEQPTVSGKFCNDNCHSLFNEIYDRIVLGMRPSRGQDLMGRKPNPGNPLKRSALFASFKNPPNFDRMPILKKRRKDTNENAIHSNSRYILRRLGVPEACAKCGGFKNLEVSHKRPVASFHQDTLVSQINDPSNLWYLCRKHHREYDNNKLV